MDFRGTINLNEVVHFRWAEKVLDAPSEFIAAALTESFTVQWGSVKDVLVVTLEKTAEEDVSGAASLRMILALCQV